MKPRKYIRKKRRLTSTKDKAIKVCEEAWKAACRRRDNNTCQVHGESCPDPVKQVDHFRTRTHGWTFFMVENGTTVCSGLNQNKSMGINNAAEKIAFVVLKREGQEMVNFLLAKRPKPKKWDISELEDLTVKLNGMFLTNPVSKQNPGVIN